MEREEGVPVAKKEPNYRGIKAMPFIIGNETFEKLGTNGIGANLLVYLTTVFNLKSIDATNVLNIFNGTCNIGTLVGAFVCDTYLGRYKTIGIASVSTFLGMLLITLTAAVQNLHPPKCTSAAGSSCHGPSPVQLTVLFAGFVLQAIGASGIRPCNLAFGVDQFNPNTDSGRRGRNSFFNWYFFTYTFGLMVSLTLIIYVQSNVNWAIGLAIPTFLMFLSCTFFFVGSRIYVKVLPEGSPLTSLVQTLVVSFKKRKFKLPEQPSKALFNHFSAETINSRLAHTTQFRFLNKAAIRTPEDDINADGSASNPWRLRSVQQVEELKCIIRVIPIWLSGIVYYIVIIQLQNYVVLQALQADRSLGSSGFKIPAGSYNVFSFLALTIMIPIYDRILVPVLRRINGNEQGMTILQRIGIGTLLGVLAMIIAGVVEKHRRTVANTQPTLGFVAQKGAISAMSAQLLIPQLLLGGLSEGFSVIGYFEFFYKEVPENMRSVGPSFFLSGCAIASYLSTFMSSVVHDRTAGTGRISWLADDLNKGGLDKFYYIVGLVQLINLGYFIVCAKWYKYRSEENGDIEVDKINGI